MKKAAIYPVILAGGIGERFWPASRVSRPKQLLTLLHSRSLFEETLARALKLAPASRIVIVTRASMAAAIRKIVGRRPCKMIAEPRGRNTAPAIASAASFIWRQNPEAVMAVLSSDHLLSPLGKFVRCLRTAAQAACRDKLVVFGICPDRPETGYGYIRVKPSKGKVLEVQRFLEKPSLASARKFLRRGNYLWNSGMFVWKVKRIREELKYQMPRLFRLCLQLDPKWGTPVERRGIRVFYQRAPSQSIDYGVMENARNTTAVKAEFTWDDVGSWESLWRIRKADARGNVRQGQTVSLDNTKTLLFAESGLVAACGLQNMVVVQSRGATLVLPRERLSEMKKLIASVRADKKTKGYLE